MKLLTPGNSKLGKSIGAWSIPAITTCPGRSSLCERLCYAERYVKQYKIDYAPKLEASKRVDFVSAMVKEAREYSRVRVHVSGDFYSAEYVRAWIAIAKRSPRTLFFCYTRSWRIDSIRKALEELKALPNFVLNYSCDKETGVPDAEWTAYMSVDDSDTPAVPVDMVFRVKRNTKQVKMGGVKVCPPEIGAGFGKGVTCGACRLCFKRKE
jgi:hypothetical protein